MGDSSRERYANLLTLGNKYKGEINADRMMKIFDLTYDRGGATWNKNTVFQTVTIPAERIIWVKGGGNTNWQKVDLNLYFQ